MKESVRIPVIGNGDIIDEKSAVKMFEYTGVDGIMIGRGALGNPWIFNKLIYYLENGKYKDDVNNEEKLNIILRINIVIIIIGLIVTPFLIDQVNKLAIVMVFFFGVLLVEIPLIVYFYIEQKESK